MKAIFSLCIAGLIVILDSAGWILMIRTAPGPFILSGLVEAVLDHRIIQNLLSSHTHAGAESSQGLGKSELVDLLAAVLASNLEIGRAPVDPQEELRDALNICTRSDQVGIHLRAMLTCQY